MNAGKNVLSNNYKNMELDEYLKQLLKETGYGGVDIQKTPIGTRITLYVTRPGLVIGRKGSGIKDLTTKLEKKGNAEKNMQNLKKPNPNQNFKTKDIKDKIVKQIIPKEKGEGVKEK